MRKLLPALFFLVLSLHGYSQNWKNYLVSNFLPVIGLDSNQQLLTGTSGFLFRNQEGSWIKAGTLNREPSAVATDPQGTVWATSVTQQSGNLIAGGLTKFDGISTFTYTTQNSGLVSGYVTHVSIGRDGSKWVCTEEGVSKFDGINWTNYTTQNSGLAEDFVKWSAEGADGSVWFAVNTGVSRLLNDSWTSYTTQNSGLVSDQVNAIYIDRNGNAWFATDAGVSVYNGSVWTNYTSSNSGLANDQVRHITQDSQGNMLLATAGGLSKFNGTVWTNFNMSNTDIPTNDLRYVLAGRSGNTWVSTGSAILLFTGSAFIEQTWSTVLAANQVHTITFDRQNNPWLGTYFQGAPSNRPIEVMKVSGSGISRFDYKISSIHSDRQQNVWLTSAELIKNDGADFTAFTNSNSPVTEYASCVSNDRQGNIWIASMIGAARFDGSAWTDYPSNTILPGFEGSFSASRIVPDSSDNVWFAFGNGISGSGFNTSMLNGVIKFDGTNWEQLNSSNSGLIGDEVNDIAVDPAGNVWFATGSGLSKRSISGEWTNYTIANSGLIDNRINAVVCDNVGRIWLGTYAGLMSFNGQDWLSYPNFNAQLQTPNMKRLVIDRVNKLWVLYESAARFSTLVSSMDLPPGGCPGLVTGSVFNQESCLSYTWNGNVYTQSGEYYYSYVNENDCPAVDTLRLTILKTSSSSTEATACDSYEWNGNTYVASGTYEYHSTASNGCDSTAVLNLIINTSSQAPSSITASAATIAPGAPVTLTVNGGSLGTNAGWAWYSSTCGGTPVGSGNSITVNPQVTTTYFVRAEGSCNNTPCTSVTINVQSIACGPVSISSDAANNSVCRGERVRLTVQGNLPAGAEWVWFRGSCGNGNIIGTGSTISVRPNTSTTYYVRATGCSNNCQSITIAVRNGQLFPSFITGPFFVCVGNPVRYRCTPVPGAASYTWSLPPGWTLISGQGTTQITVRPGNANGMIRVSPSNACGQGFVSQFPVRSFRCGNNNHGGGHFNNDRITGEDIRTWPVPANDFLNLDAGKLTATKIEIRNMDGQMVFASAWQRRIDVSRLRSGIYLLGVYTSQGLIWKKINIVR